MRCLTMLMVSAVVLTGARAEGEGPPANAAETAAIQRLVQEEVQRQLPAAVEKEVALALAKEKQRESKGAVELWIDSRHNSICSTLQTLRSQLELYRIQHGDDAPTFEAFEHFQALTQKTDVEGHVGPKGKFGPYLQNAPVNAFNGASEIVPVGQARSNAGWVYKEDHGKYEIRAVLPAEIAKIRDLMATGNYEIPDAAREAKRVEGVARVSSVRSTLQTVRSQLELYKLQHGDHPPTLEQMKDWTVMLGKTQHRGNSFGPYLQGAPVNPFNGKTLVMALGQATAEAGWTYEVKDDAFSFRAVVPDKATLAEAELGLEDAEIAGK